MKISQDIKAIILGLILIAGISQVHAGWTPAPVSGPPGNNVFAPINAGGGVLGESIHSQVKTGILNLNHLFTRDLTVLNSDLSTTGIVDGKSVLVANGDNTGKVKWGSLNGGLSYQLAQAYMELIDPTCHEESNGHDGVRIVCNNTGLFFNFSDGELVVRPAYGAPANAFIKVMGVTKNLGGTNYTVDGIQCNAAAGWRITGCWQVQKGDDNDIWHLDNGCATNDFRGAEGPEEGKLNIMCIKQN